MTTRQPTPPIELTGTASHWGGGRTLPAGFAERLTGRRIVSLGRRAKYLIADLDELVQTVRRALPRPVEPARAKLLTRPVLSRFDD